MNRQDDSWVYYKIWGGSTLHQGRQRQELWGETGKGGLTSFSPQSAEFGAGPVHMPTAGTLCFCSLGQISFYNAQSYPEHSFFLSKLHVDLVHIIIMITVIYLWNEFLFITSLSVALLYHISVATLLRVRLLVYPLQPLIDRRVWCVHLENHWEDMFVFQKSLLARTIIRWERKFGIANMRSGRLINKITFVLFLPYSYHCGRSISSMMQSTRRIVNPTMDYCPSRI